MDKKSFKYWNILYPFIALGLILALWAITAAAIGQEIVFPKLSSTIKAFFDLIKTKSFYVDLGYTLLRVIISFLISFCLATILSIIAKILNGVGKVISTMASVIRVVPTMSIILLALIWLSTLRAPMLVAVLVIFPLQYSGLLNSIENVSPKLQEMATIYNVPIKKQIIKMYLPQMSKDVFSSIQSTISLNVKLIIAAEVMAQTRDSMGLQMQQASMYLEMDVLLAWTVAAVLLGLILEGIVELLKMAFVKGR